MIIRPGLRKLMLAIHVVTSVGWLGSVAAFLVLAIAGLTIGDPETVRASYISLDLLARFIVVPLGVASLAIGVVESLGTRWGLFRYYWIVIKLAVTAIALAILLLQLANIRYIAARAALRALTGADFYETRLSFIIHSGGGLLVLLVPLVLSIYKPRGRTGYGQRKRRVERLPAR